MSFNTTEQQQYIDASGKGAHQYVESLAGTGKTTTAIAMCNNHSELSSQMIVFAKRNSEETQKVLPSNATCSTRHSMCLKWLYRGKVRPKVNKFTGYNDRFDSIGKDLSCIWKVNPDIDYRKVKKEDPKHKDLFEDSANAEDLLGLVKNTYINPSLEDVCSLADTHGVSFIQQGIPETIVLALALSDSIRDEITFDDMCRFPVLDKRIFVGYSVPDIFILDEAQDSNPITIALMGLIKDKCETHLFGDKWQSIQGFTGADNNAMDKLSSTITPSDLHKLTINFRCSKAVIEEARRCHPHIDIKAWDGAREGFVKNITPEEVSVLMRPGDCVIARYNKIIIPMAFKLLREGKRASIQGNKDFIKSIKRTVASIKANNIIDFSDKLNAFRNRQLEKATTESGREIINDKFDTIEMFADNCKTPEDIPKYIDDLFSEQVSDYTLSTAHRSKGLQFTNIFMMDSENFTAKQAKLQWQLQQEDNLQYVARTRAQDGLYYVNAK